MQNNPVKSYIILPIILLTMTSLACSILPIADIPKATQDSIQKTDSDALETNSEDQSATITGQPNFPMDPPPEEAGACANPLYPLVPGYRWVYEVNSRSESTEISMTVSEIKGQQAILDVSYSNSGITSELTVDCDEGEILNFPTILLGYLFGDIGGSIEIENVRGVYAPNYDYLIDNLENAEWSGEYLASGEISTIVDGDEFVGTLSDSPVAMDWEVTPEGDTIFNPIEVAAGSYDNVLRITRQAELDFDASLTEDGVTTNLVAVMELTTINWFVPNTGMVRQEVSESNIRVFGVRFPLYMEGDIELLQFSKEE